MSPLSSESTEPDFRLTPDAAAFFEAATGDEQRELDRIFGLIRGDPWIDNKVKIVFHFPPASGVLYVHSEFRIFYHHLRSGLIVVIAIWRPRGSRFD